jgi:hypothetical protein
MEIGVTTEVSEVAVTIFSLKGDVTTASVGQFEQRARQAFDAGSRNFLIDLTKVTLLTSGGMRVIHQIFLWLRDDPSAEGEAAMLKGITAGTYRSPHLKLLNPNPSVLETLKLAGFDMFLEILDDKKQALASFAGTSGQDLFAGG